jgi:outer membrane protein OmpA-like peptidoglycan-associated protein
MKAKSAIFLAISFLVLGVFPVSAQADAEGCKDHPLFSRMPNFYIGSCEVNDFDGYEFYLDEDKTVTVEGAKTYLDYYIKEGAPVPSELKILRNYIAAAQKIGGQVLYQGPYNAYLKITRDGGEFWVHVKACDGGDCYQLAIIEKNAMVQEVTANDILDSLNSTGFIALDIRFETSQATIKPESKPIVDQIAAALRDNPALNVSVEGHTDNTGTPQGNKALSLKRAEAVVAALVQAGIAAGRLTAAGWGQEKPVADNRSEEGRTRNRRVEVVKK